MTWVELRVHGVSGTPPESLLCAPHVAQVAGDEYSRFFRPVHADGTEQRDARDGHRVEAYHWGKFTSGTWRQGLALLLLPFGLVNAAQFMLPRADHVAAKWMHLIAGSCLRALGVLLTCLISFTFGLIFIDLVAWRWAVGWGPLASVDTRVVLLAGVALAALSILSLALLGTTWRTRLPQTHDESDMPTESDLDPEFFTGDANSWTMRRLHLAAGFGMVALLTALTRQVQDGSISPNMAPVWIIGVVTAVLVVIGDPERTVTGGFTCNRDAPAWLRERLSPLMRGLAVVTGGLREGPDSGAAQEVAAATVRRRLGWLLLTLALAVLVREAVMLALEGGSREAYGHPSSSGKALALTDFDAVADALMITGVALLGILHAANLLHVWTGISVADAAHGRAGSPDRSPGTGRQTVRLFTGSAWTSRDARLRLVMTAPPLVLAVLVLLTDVSPVIGAVAVAVLVTTTGLSAVAAYRVLSPACTGEPADEFFFRPYAGGMTAFLVAALSVLIGVGFSAAAANATAAVLPAETGATPTSSDGDTLTLSTEMLDRVSYAWGIAVIALALVVILTATWWLTTRQDYRRSLDADLRHPPHETTTIPTTWHGRVARAMFLARMKSFVPLYVILTVGLGLLVAGAQVYERFGTAEGAAAWWVVDWLSQPRGAPVSDVLIGLGSWALVALGGLLVTISRGAIKDTEARRGINVVWDIFSFWPHAVHPFVPRPYSRWTVIELRNRIRFHLDGSLDGSPTDPGPTSGAGSRRVVLAGHSQGSLICYAALLMLTPAERERVAFLSFGSQLRVIYPRAFPAYVNLATHRWLFEGLAGAWINLYRRTDPLAGPVLSWCHEGTDADPAWPPRSRHLTRPGAGSDGVRAAGDGLAPDTFPRSDGRRRECGNDWRLLDPVPQDTHLQTGAVTRLNGHSNFWLDPAWPDALAALRAVPSTVVPRQGGVARAAVQPGVTTEPAEVSS